jgi:Uma2 family endonuclease
MEPVITQRRYSRMSGAEFRAFQARRPDHERWELLAGVPMMMAPSTIAHNLIASNFERLLNDALDRHAPSLLATQRPALELGDECHKPEADVGVIDADYAADQRFVDRAHLLAEVASETDDLTVPGTNRRWIAVKQELYRSHSHCRATLVILQDRMQVELDVKTETGWKSSVLKGGETELIIPAFGFRSALGNLYRKIVW